MNPRSLLLLPLLFFLACETPGKPPLLSASSLPAEAAADVEARDLVAYQQRLEARLIGLMDEVDRLARRVVALEKHLDVRPPREHPGTARVPEAPPAEAPAGEPGPEPGAAPPPGETPPAPTREPAAAGWTGLLVDARSAITEGAESPQGRSHSRWRLLDFAAQPILGSGDVADRPGGLPDFWILAAEVPVGTGTIPHLGGKPLVLRAVYAELFDRGEGKEALFYLDDAAAGRVRDLPGLREILGSGRVAILLHE